MANQTKVNIQDIIKKIKSGSIFCYAQIMKHLYENSPECKQLVDDFFKQLPDPIDSTDFKKVISNCIYLERKNRAIKDKTEKSIYTKIMIEGLEDYETSGNSSDRDLMRLLFASSEIFDEFDEYFDEIYGEEKIDKKDLTKYDFANKLYNKAFINYDAEDIAEIDHKQTKKSFTPSHGNLTSPDGIIKKLDTKLVGQKYAKKQVANALFNYFSGFKNKNLIGAFMLAGDPGIGKTEMAKAVADLYFDGRLCVIRGGDYSTDTTNTTLTGAGAGLVGYGDPNPIQQSLEKWDGKPGVIIFDEFDQMHHLLHNWLYSILDEGKFNANVKNSSRSMFDFDDEARTETVEVDLSNTLIFLTCNLGTNQRALGFKTSASQLDDVKRTIDTIKKEGQAKGIGAALFNRVEIIPMGDLSHEEKVKITTRLQRETANNLIKTMQEQTKKIGTQIADTTYKIRFLENMPEALLKLSGEQIRGVKQKLEYNVKQPIVIEYKKHKKQLNNEGVAGIEFLVTPNTNLNNNSLNIEEENPFTITTKIIKK